MRLPPSEKRKDLVCVEELTEASTFTPVMNARYPLQRIADAHRHVDAGHERGNVVVPMTDHPPASDRHDASRSKVIRWLSHRGSRPAEASASAA